MKLRVALVAICAWAALSLPGSAAAFATYPDLNQTASWLAQRDVTVRCLTERESLEDSAIALGASAYVPWTEASVGSEHGRPKNYTVFAWPLCNVLLDLKAGHAEGWTLDDVTWALFVITHESGHLRGKAFPLYWSESEVNCWALRRVAAVARTFGISEEALPLIRRQAVYIYHLQPPAYHKLGCTKGLIP